MKRFGSLLVSATALCLLAGSAIAQDIAWIETNNGTGVILGVYAEPSPDNNADDNGYTEYEPASYSTINLLTIW
ncbi:MAG: hypothetical protein GF401_00615 [Chitinivibrionales bacterium]|nr:hypothetical protein [Chitinivibrionales bacterium]